MGIFNILTQLLNELVDKTLYLIESPFQYLFGENLDGIPINILIFSETPIFTTDLHTLLLLFFSIFYSMFFIVLLYKVTKKIIKKVFGVFKL